MKHLQIDPRAERPAPGKPSDYIPAIARRESRANGAPAFLVTYTPPGELRSRQRLVPLDYAWPTDTVERRRHAVAEALGVPVAAVFDGWGELPESADRHPFAVAVEAVAL